MIIGTPIGNLGDMTPRALEALKEADYVLAEDTRETAKLLAHFGIKRKLVSYHKFNERAREDSVVEDLQRGKKIALVSDAGMPTVADPGAQLIERCHKEELQVTCLPGPSALITALALSGLSYERFQFAGFVPKKPSDIRKTFAEALSYPGLTLFFETPHNLKRSLALLPKDCTVTVARELTKLYEELIQGRPEEILAHFETTPLKGELVLILSGNAPLAHSSSALSDEALMALLKENLSHKNASELAAKITGKPKRLFYHMR